MNPYQLYRILIRSLTAAAFAEAGEFETARRIERCGR